MIATPIETKPNLKLRIFATLVDYAIYLLFFWMYVRLLGTKGPDDSYKVDGWLADPLFLFWLFYFPGTEAINGATPGHDIMKLKVLTAEGRKPDFWTAIKRRICDPLDIFFYGIPAMIVISKTDKHQRIGDLLAGTVVIKRSDISQKEISFK